MVGRKAAEEREETSTVVKVKVKVKVKVTGIRVGSRPGRING